MTVRRADRRRTARRRVFPAVQYGNAVIWCRAGRQDSGMVDGGGTDWAGHYAWSAGREPRPLLLAACRELGAGQDRTAIDLGCGEGTGALELLARGWSVMAVDAEPAGLALLRARSRPQRPDGSAFSRVLHRGGPAVCVPDPCRLQPAVLSFAEVPGPVGGIRQALAPGGVFAGQLFGTHDSGRGP